MILMVFGLPGTGKSFFAKHMVKVLDAVHLNTDMVRKEANLQGRYDEETKEIVYDLLLREMTTHVSENQSVIVDGTFHKKQVRDRFMDKANQLGQQVFFIEMKAGDETVKRRLKSEREYSEADYQVYLQIKHSFETMEQPHLELWSDTTTIDEMVKKAKAHINEYRTDQ
jgi:predicted kinase